MNLLALHHCFILGELAQPRLAPDRFSTLTQTWNKSAWTACAGLRVGALRSAVTESGWGGRTAEMEDCNSANGNAALRAYVVKGSPRSWPGYTAQRCGSHKWMYGIDVRSQFSVPRQLAIVLSADFPDHWQGLTLTGGNSG